MVAAPLSAEVTRPDPPTVATEARSEDQANSAPATTWPLASRASAARRTVSPSATSVLASGVTVTAATTCATVIAAVPDAWPDVAVMVAAPLSAEVTRPAASTVATEAALVDHDTDAPDITLPYWSRTSAVSCTVASRAASPAAEGVTVTVVGRGGSGGGGSVPPQAWLPRRTPSANAAMASRKVHASPSRLRRLRFLPTTTNMAGSSLT